jgi:trans-AT polyketide synthase/acyltransferase/oxidoreductase domain-containing protein
MATIDSMKKILEKLTEPIHVIKESNKEYKLITENEARNLNFNFGTSEYCGKIPSVSPETIGDRSFRERYNLKYSYMTGAMANGIASERMVISLGKSRILGSFGAAGLIPSRIEKAIVEIQTALPHGPYAFNLIHSPSEEALERNGVELFIKYNVPVIEASAYMDLTPYIVWYKVAGLSLEGEKIKIKNKVIAKVSRLEVAKKFMQPAPVVILKKLLADGKITKEQAEIATRISVADDITVEADSGGHTDNRPLVCILPAIIALRDELTKQFGYENKIHIGAAGGIGTPQAAIAAFALGASYIVTGSINQSCVESGSSDAVRKLLAQAEMTDVIMAPAADMFETGVKLQVLKRGTMFSGRAQKLFELYRTYNSIEEIPTAEREKIELQIFRRPLIEVWNDTVIFFKERDLELLESAQSNPKVKMALIFRWYLGLSSRWANSNEKGRELDYQIWCGPAMGAFNIWVKGTPLEKIENRFVTKIADQILKEACLIIRRKQFELLLKI